jgi:hypothetical protein
LYIPAVLESEVEKQELQIEYEQIDLDPDVYTIEEEEKPLPEFHGEPVPDDDDDDDALFEIAAGISRPKKKDLAPVVVEEPLPDDEFIELDYCWFFSRRLLSGLLSALIGYLQTMPT